MRRTKAKPARRNSGPAPARGPAAFLGAFPCELVESDRTGHRDVERLASARLRNRGALVTKLEQLGRQSIALGTEDEHHVTAVIQLVERDSAACDESDAG